MADRIRRHRETRGYGWETVEVPVDLVKWFENECAQYQTVVVDCLTLWLSNLLGRETTEAAIIRMTTDLVRTVRGVRARVFVVTNEVGMSLVPMQAAARQFRDLAGSVNQQFAEAADEVYLVVSGVALRIK
jgi:adenosylcobinamide kinase/adenosylcobinamide-phosphate guanylyltransferase